MRTTRLPSLRSTGNRRAHLNGRDDDDSEAVCHHALKSVTLRSRPERTVAASLSRTNDGGSGPRLLAVQIDVVAFRSPSCGPSTHPNYAGHRGGRRPHVLGIEPALAG